MPQLCRALRATRGVSASAWLQAFVLGVIWATYGLATGTWVLLASEAPFALGGLAIVARLLPARRTAAWTAGCAVLLGAAYTAIGPGPCLVAAALASVTVRVAQMRTTIASGTAADVSVVTWLLLAASNFAWAITGALRSDSFFAGSAAAGGVCSLAVIATCVAVNRKVGRQSTVPSIV